MSDSIINSENSSEKTFFGTTVLGHPAGLFVLFFTEMWERFSFYGMRVLLINFLTMAAVGVNPGWAWTAENAGTLFATYAGLLYLTPILGGVLADKFLGYRNSVAIGALIMTLGHALMALETELSLYGGLALLVIGTGFFKPTMTSIISQMYKDLPQKKDGAYTIFYMGVNAGAFFGMMLCGYLAEKVGWSWGFGLAGVFMLLGLLQFWFAKPLFGTIGEKPKRNRIADKQANEVEFTEEMPGLPKEEIISIKEKLNPFTTFDKIFTVISAVFGLTYLLHGPFAINGMPLIPEFFADIFGGKENLSPKMAFIIIGLVVFFLPLIISRIVRYEKVVRNRMIAVVIFAFFTVFFWMSFEQGASSLVIFARDSTTRILSGSSATAFLIIDLLLTFGPLLIVTWVLIKLWKASSHIIKLSNIVLAICFIGIWALGIWKTNRDLNTKSYELSMVASVTPELDENGNQKRDEKTNKLLYLETPISLSQEATIEELDSVKTITNSMGEYTLLNVGDEVYTTFEVGGFRYVDSKSKNDIEAQMKSNSGAKDPIIRAKVTSIESGNKVEITTSWFSILNSFFIIAFASMFSKWWESKYNPSAALKYGLGLIIMAIGFGILAFGSMGIEPGMRVSLFWLVFAYLFHTLGELCISPVGLSYVSKLVPARMIGFMFGMWYLAIAIGNYVAGSLGGMIEVIQEKYSMSTFFLIFTIIPAFAGLIIILINPFIKRLMGGVR